MDSFLEIFDVYLLEAVINGILLGGVLALLALGLNLIFGVIDVTWICYAELIMIGMYGMYYLVAVYHLPYWVAAPLCILLVAALGALLHVLVIEPLLSAPPINQLLATGGVLFFLQSFATVAFGIDFRNIGIRLPVLALGEMNFSYARLLAFAAAAIGMGTVYVFMKKTYVGTAIRAIAQDRQIMVLMGVDTRRLYIITSALGGALAGLASCLLVLMYDIHPFIGLSIGPITFLICVLGGLGNFVGGFVAAFVFAQIISLGGMFSDLEWGYVLAFAFFIIMMFIRPGGLLARRVRDGLNPATSPGPLAAVALIALPFVHRDPYHLHIFILILIWSFAYTSWSMMGRFGLISLGHGGFMGVGAYVTALLWNHLGLSPWLGIPVALACAGALAVVVAYPCFRFRITGHYFALVTLALSGIVLQIITATRDYTGGSLGYTPEVTKGSKLLAMQFDDKVVWYLIGARRLGGRPADLAWVDRSMTRSALEAISEDEDAAAAAGVNVTAREAQDHRHQRADDGVRRRGLLPVPDVHLARHGERHRRVAADGVRRGGRRPLCRARADGGRHHHHPAGRDPAHRFRHQGGGLGQSNLRRAAGAVHHLPAQGHPGQRARRDQEPAPVRCSAAIASGAIRPRIVSVGRASALRLAGKATRSSRSAETSTSRPTVLADFEEPGRHVQRVADIGDLAANVADFAGDDLATMKGGAELGQEAETLAVAFTSARRSSRG